MTWLIIGDLPTGEGKLYGRIDDDGLMRVTAVREHPELLSWIEENGEPEPIGASK